MVLLLPGILGSELDDTRGRRSNRIWIDPIGILFGEFELLELARNGTDDANPRVRIEATDVVDLTYREIKHKLRRKGFDARHYFFDWRRNLDELAARLADYITQRVPAGRPLSLVAHSMGGLVSRTLFALHPQVASRVNRLIMLGTPNFGSFSPAQVFSGDDTMVRVVAGLDLVNSRKDLTATLASFPGLVAMLPNPAKVRDPRFLEPDTWPSSLLPATALRRAKAAQGVLDQDVAERNRYTLIAGTGRDTVAEAEEIRQGEFKFRDGDGDGTVPLNLCLLPGVGQTYFTDAKHGSMPKDNEVIDAVADILTTGEAGLPKSVPSRRSQRALRPHREDVIEIPDFITKKRRSLGTRRGKAAKATRRRAVRVFATKLKPAEKSQIERLAHQAASAFIDAAEDRKPSERAAPARPVAPAAQRLPRRLLIKTVLGSVTAARSSALALGVFPAVRPQGSLAALDSVVGGYVTQLFQQGAIHGGLGEVMFLPTPGASIPAELALLVGLGEARSFTADTLERVGENLARALTQVRVPDIATVAIGGGTLLLKHALRPLLEGFLVGLNARDPDNLFRSITLCEVDPARLAEIRATLATSVDHWRERGVVLELKELAPSKEPAPRLQPYRDLAYWIETVPKPEGIRYFLLGSAVNLERRISTSTKVLAKTVLDLQSAMEDENTDDSRKETQQKTFGTRLARLVPKPFADELTASASGASKYDHARIDLAESAAMVPWELLRVDGEAAGLRLPVVRRLGISGDHRPAAEYLLETLDGGSVRVAIVADPTDDLDGARTEGEELAKKLRTNPAFEVRSFIGSEECKESTVFELIDAGAVDVLHYAGHGCFNPARPETSGLFINGESDGILTATEISRARRPPFLIFTNACQVGIVPPRIRKRTASRRRAAAAQRHRPGPHRPPPADDRPLRARQPYGFAESLLRIGVRAYVGTFWSIPDDSAVTFAHSFYDSVSRAKDLGEAIFEARNATRQAGGSGSWAWASYMLYGPAWLKLLGGPAAG